LEAKILKLKQVVLEMRGIKNVYNVIMDKTPTHALFTQHYISLAC